MRLSKWLFGEREKSSSEEVELTVKQYADTAGSWHTEVYHQNRRLASYYALSHSGMVFFRHCSRAIKHARDMLRYMDSETVKVKL